jgi:hypothetical protein
MCSGKQCTTHRKQQGKDGCAPSRYPAGSINGRPYAAREGKCVAFFAPGANIVGPARSPARAGSVRATSPVLAPAVAAGVATVYVASFPLTSPPEVHFVPPCRPCCQIFKQSHQTVCSGYFFNFFLQSSKVPSPRIAACAHGRPLQPSLCRP